MAKRGKILLLATFFIIYSVLISGCWNYREIDKLAIVAGVAVDRGSKGDNYLITAEIVDLKGQKEVKTESKKVSSEGKTVIDAIRNIIKISAKKLYFGHTKVLIVSQDVAKDGLIPVIDLFLRDQEPRIEMYILISKEKTAKELLEQQSITTEIRSFEMNDMIRAKKNLPLAPKVELYRFLDTLSVKGESSILPTLGTALNEGKRTAELSGTAVFKQDKLIGFLDELDTKYLLFIKDEIEGGVLVQVEDTKGTPTNVTFEIQENKTKVKPVYSNGKISIVIDIHSRVGINELDGVEDFISEKRREELKTDAEKSMQENIKQLVKKVQEEYGVDIFGFGRIVRAQKPSVWKSVEADWYNLFRKIDVTVNVWMDIDNSGLSSRPIKKGD